MKRVLQSIALILAFSLLHFQVHAGGPLGTVNGQAIVYRTSDFPVPYSTDRGSLGSYSNDQATNIVRDCFQAWQDVDTATITFASAGQLPVDLVASNYKTFFDSNTDGINPIIFDSDGGIIENYFGEGSKQDVMGFAFSWYNTGGYYTEGTAVLNGVFSTLSETEFKATFVHEFGHFFGLDHCQINVEYVDDDFPYPDGNTANNEYVPTMYPFGTGDDTSLAGLNPDDEAAITLLYPGTNVNTYYGRITGTVKRGDGSPVFGANVVAVQIGDEDMSRFSSVSDYYKQIDGSYEMLVTPGKYKLLIEPINKEFTAGSSVGPYAESSEYGLSFLNPVTKEYYNGNDESADEADLNAYEEVTVSAGQTVSGIDFIAEGGPSTTTTVSGTATTTISSSCEADAPVECVDDAAGFYGCCYTDYNVCCYDDHEPWCCPEGSVCADYYFGCDSSATTTSQPSTTTTVPGGSTTTTVSGGVTEENFIVGININGQDSPVTAFSGTLPGTSPSVTEPLLYSTDGTPIPLWYDRVMPPPDPALMEKTKELIRQKKFLKTQNITVYDVGDQRSFWVKDENDSAWRNVSATNMNTGDHSYMFVDDTLSVPDSALETYVTEFETMYDVLADNIGGFSDRDGNGKVTILLYDFNDGGTVAGYMSGYFWSKDYLEDEDAQTVDLRSNEMDIIYMRGDEPTGWGQIGTDFYDYNLTTLVHEYQHLVNFGITYWTQQNPGVLDAWIDEMMSMASETMYLKEKLKSDSSYTHPSMEGEGYLWSRIEYYNSDMNSSIRNGHGLTYWNYDGDVIANYSLSYLFGQYLTLQSTSGQGIFKEILNYMITNSTYDYRAVVGAASQSISGINSWTDLLKSWAIANMANKPVGSYGYKGEITLSAHGPTLNRVRIYNGGSVYRIVDGALSAPLNSGRSVKFFNSEGNPVSRKGLCSASLILGEHSEESNLLRDFRDEVLSGSETGKELVRLYYLHKKELISVITEHPEIRAGAKRILMSMIQAIKASLNGGSIIISNDTEEAINDLCAAISREAGPELTEAVFRLKREFEKLKQLNE